MSWQLIRTNQLPRTDPDIDASGFYGLLQRTEIEASARTFLPHTCDLFEEAHFFIQLLASLEPCDSNLAVANWCVGTVRWDVKEHKFKIGQLVYFHPKGAGRIDPVPGPYQITKRLPAAKDGEFQYEIRSNFEEHDRVARESELTRT